MPDANDQCTYCHHDSMHHVWPGCDFPNRRKIEFIPDAWIVVETCGCSGFDQPGEAPKGVPLPNPPEAS